MLRFGAVRFGLLAALATWPAASATFEVHHSTGRDFSVITIEGELQFGDEKKFIEQALRVQEGVVLLGSNGGNLHAGINIGKAIRLKGLATYVPEDTRCASACAIAWLAGTPRFMSARAKVGFHAAYMIEDGEAEVSGPANAIVGAYLSTLGLSDRAITYITGAPPQGMRWLSFEDASKVGIEVKPFELQEAQSSPSQRKPRTEAPTASLEAPTGDPPNNVEPPTRHSQPPNTSTATLVPPPAPNYPKFQVPEPPQLEPQVLDLARLDSAGQVQRRLQERGYFRGVADGVWGPKSRLALRDFKAFNGLGADDVWDLRTQLALFDDRYRVATADYVPPNPFVTDGLRPFPPSSGATLHPLNSRDAIAIQNKLAALGFYRTNGDGIWGLASRSALRDFKVANGLQADDIWDKDVEALMASGRAVTATATPFGEWAMTGTSCLDQSNMRRLAVSATEIIAGGGVCRMEQPLARFRDIWSGAARCSRDGQEVAARVALRVVGGRLLDQSVVGTAQNPRPPRFERCR